VFPEIFKFIACIFTEIVIPKSLSRDAGLSNEDSEGRSRLSHFLLQS
jgi:hypothetical protein